MRKLFFKIFLTIVICAVAYFCIHTFNEFKDETVDDGKCIIEVVALDGTKIEKECTFVHGQYLYDVLVANFDIRCEKSIYGAVLYDIEDIKTDFYSHYLAIYIDGDYSDYGISHIALHDGIKISIVETVV